MSDDLAFRLNALGQELSRQLSTESSDSTASAPEFVDYHGFRKSTLASPEIHAVAARHGFGPSDVQIELVRLERSMPREAHYHEITHAHVVILDGPSFRNPDRAWIYVGSGWSPAAGGTSLDIPPHVVHGFYLESETGALDFLSIQSPPLVRGDHDDFIATKVSEPVKG